MQRQLQEATSLHQTGLADLHAQILALTQQGASAAVPAATAASPAVVVAPLPPAIQPQAANPISPVPSMTGPYNIVSENMQESEAKPSYT